MIHLIIPFASLAAIIILLMRLPACMNMLPLVWQLWTVSHFGSGKYLSWFPWFAFLLPDACIPSINFSLANQHVHLQDVNQHLHPACYFWYWCVHVFALSFLYLGPGRTTCHNKSRSSDMGTSLVENSLAQISVSSDDIGSSISMQCISRTLLWLML